MPERRAERDALLGRLARFLQEDDGVAAAWLAGSLGRGDADDLSDLDVWVVVQDEAIGAIRSDPCAWTARLAPPLLALPAPQNAPAGGAYLLALYEGTTGPHQVDWYWEPVSLAMLPEGVRLLFDRVGLPRSDLRPFEPAPAPQSAAEREAAAAGRLTFFWAMLPIAAKKIARHQPWEAVGMLAMLRNALREAGELMAIDPTDEGLLDLPPPGDPSAQWEMLLRLGREGSVRLSTLAAQGIQVPALVVPPTLRLLERIGAAFFPDHEVPNGR
jgi:Nucleotidyltransferase domain